MKAIVINGCCGANALQVSEIALPQVRPGWVLVRVRAFGLNHSEALLRMYEADQPYIHTPIVPGIECVGEIADASDSHFQAGDRVMALMGGMGRSFNGSYAEYALLPTKQVFKADIPELDWVSLAALPETYFTAYGSLVQGLQLQSGDTLLVRGATSTVGQAAIQLAKALGCYVIASCRRQTSFPQLYQLGADVCLLDNQALADGPWKRQPNKVLELVGPKTLHDSLYCVTQPGIVCSTGLLGGQFTVPQFDPIKYIPNGVYLTGFFSNYPDPETIKNMLSLIRKKHLRPLYSKVFPFNEIATAHTLLEQGSAGGKIIIKV